MVLINVVLIWLMIIEALESKGQKFALCVVTGLILLSVYLRDPF